ncbi:ribonuclease H-like domain-containing protein [Tanacetum coccineum]
MSVLCSYLSRTRLRRLNKQDDGNLYIAITDHILWDIITNGDQATTDPASSSAPKTSLAANARRNNEKALNILLSAIPDRHLLSFHDATNAKTLWTAIKARFGGNEASKKMQKNLLKQQFETFTIGSREELDSAYERFQNILSMLELYDAKVSLEDANLKFLRSLPSVWHVVATMIRGQPGLDELEFDDLYNNLKVYEHELKGVSNSNSQNIAFLSTEVKGSTLKQSTVEPAHIPKGYAQAASSTMQAAPNCASHSDEIICSFFAQQASMPTTHDDEDLLQIDEDAMEEIDIRWQVAMITARIRKFMRKTGRPIDLKPKNGITFDKSKIECFNCQKLGHFARECRFAKYQENRANGRQEKRIVAIEDSNSKALVATDNNEDIDWTKEFDAEPVTLAMMALTEVEQDDWSMEFDAEHVHFGQDGLGDFDWSNKADDTPVSLALMATNSEMEYDLKIRDLKLEEKQKELDQALKERDDFKEKLEKWSNAAVLQNEVLNKQRYLSDKSCIGFGVESSSGMDSENSSRNTNSSESSYPNFQKAKGFHSVPPPTGTIIPPRENVSFTGIDELAIRNKVLNQENTKSSQPEIDRNKVIIEDWVDSDDEETVLNTSEIQKKTVSNSENSETSFENSPNHLIKDCNLHERTFKQTQTHKPKGTQGSRDTRPVWNNIQRVTHSNFSGNSRPRTTKFSPSTGFFHTSRTPHRPQRPKKIVKSIWVKKGSTVGTQAVLPQTVKESVIMKSNQTWKPKGAYLDSVNYTLKQFEYGNPEEDLKDYAIIDSGCSGSMTGDKDKLSDFKEFKGGYVAFGNDSKGGRISGKGTIKTSCLDFEKVSYVEELKFNLLSVSQICDKKHNVLFTDKECLSIPSKATKDEAVYAQKIGHVNFNNINKLVKGNQENQKGKGPDWMFDLELLTPSMNYIPVRKENYADSGGQETAYNDVEDLDDQQFIVHGPNIHAVQNKPSEERTADKEVPLSSDEQALHDELVSLMHQESLAKLHNECTKTGKPSLQIPYDEFQQMIISLLKILFDDENPDTEEGGEADYQHMDPTIRKEPKKVSQALADESWVEAMQEELLQFKLQDVWVYCDLPDWQMESKVAFLNGNITEEVFQVTPKVSHLHAVKRIFSDYAGDNPIDDHFKEDVQYLRRRLLLGNAINKQLWLISSTSLNN